MLFFSRGFRHTYRFARLIKAEIILKGTLNGTLGQEHCFNISTMFQTLPDAVVLFDFELMLNSLVNSYCHIETLTPFYGTFARKSDAMTPKQCFKYNYPSKPLRLIRMDGLILKHFSWSGSDLSG